MAGECDGFPRRLERLPGMTPGVGAVADVLLEFRVLEHAVQKPRSRHDDVVGFQFGELKGRNRLVARPVELAVRGGSAIALALVEAKAAVAINYSHSKGLAQKTAEEICRKGERAQTV